MDKTLPTHSIFHLDDINKVGQGTGYRPLYLHLTLCFKLTSYNTVNKDKFKNKTEKIQSAH